MNHHEFTDMIPVQVTPESPEPITGVSEGNPYEADPRYAELVKLLHYGADVDWDMAEIQAETIMRKLEVPLETPKPWDSIARTLGYEDRHDMQGALAACASYLRNPPKPSMTGVENQHPNQLASELDKAVKAMETPEPPNPRIQKGNVVRRMAPPHDGWLGVVVSSGVYEQAVYVKWFLNNKITAAKKIDLEVAYESVEAMNNSDDEKIERMAKAMCNELGGDGTVSEWASSEERTRNLYRTYAKAALAALEAPAPPGNVTVPVDALRTVVKFAVSAPSEFGPLDAALDTLEAALPPETPVTPKLPEGVRRDNDDPDVDHRIAVVETPTRNFLIDDEGELINGYVVTEEYILNKIQEDIEKCQ